MIAAEEEYIRRNIAGQNSKQAKGRRNSPRTRAAPQSAAARRGSGDGASARGRRARRRSGASSAERASTIWPSMDRIARRAASPARLTRGEVVGLVGPNGAGKSTLLRAIVGEHPVDAGELRLGASITRRLLSAGPRPGAARQTLFDIIHDLRPQWERGLVQGHLGRFGFSGDEVQRRAGTLSGGEQARLALAMMMLSGANLLILDEPTNHLDVETIEALEDAIDAYDGTVILVSHDRALLRALTTRVWALHDGRIEEYPGRFEEWEIVQEERARVAEEAKAAEAARQRESERRPEGSPGRECGPGASGGIAAGPAQARGDRDAHCRGRDHDCGAHDRSRGSVSMRRLTARCTQSSSRLAWTRHGPS